MQNVLIVDDDPVVLNIFQRIFEEDYNISASQSGEEAIEQIHQNDFDLIITDIQMQPVDGFEILKNIKIHKPKLPVIMMSKYSSLEHLRKAWKLGAFDFIHKPLKLREVKEIVEIALKMGSDFCTNMALKENYLFREKTFPGDLKVWDQKAFLDSLANDASISIDVIHTFKEAIQTSFQDIENHIIAKKRSLLHHAVHKLQGTCDHLYAEEICDILTKWKSTLDSGEYLTKADLSHLKHKMEILFSKLDQYSLEYNKTHLASRIR